LGLTKQAMDQNKISMLLGDSSPFFTGHQAGVNFATPAQGGNPYAVTLSNSALPADAAGGVRKIILFAGALALTTALPGVMTDGAFNDASGNAGVSATSSEQDQISVLSAYLLSRPTMLKGIHFQFSKEDQGSQPLVIRTIDPFNNRANKIVRLQTQFNQFSNNQTTVYVSLDEIVGAGKAIEYTLMAGATGVPNVVTMTFDFGMSFDPETLLALAYKEAARFVSKVGDATIAEYNSARSQAMLMVTGA
jgi:hypothetical protein